MRGRGRAWWLAALVLTGCGAPGRGEHPTGTAQRPVAAAPSASSEGPPGAAVQAPPAASPEPPSTGTGDSPPNPSTSSGASDDDAAGSDTSTAPIEPAQPGADGKTFTVDARLVDPGKRVSHCGIMHVVMVMKLEVVEVIDGHYDGSTLYVYVSCPEMWLRRERQQFEKGKVYRWTLDTRIQRPTAGTKFDAFRGIEAPRYRLQRLEVRP